MSEVRELCGEPDGVFHRVAKHGVQIDEWTYDVGPTTFTKDATDMIRRRERNGLTLAVGHIERRRYPGPGHAGDRHYPRVGRLARLAHVRGDCAERAETQEDLLISTLRFRNGVVGSLIANWVTPSKTCECRVFGERGMATVDYLSQDLYFHENSDAPSR
jgi:hypothetical protein